MEQINNFYSSRLLVEAKAGFERPLFSLQNAFQIACIAISRTYEYKSEKVSSKLSLCQANQTASITITAPMPVLNGHYQFLSKPHSMRFDSFK